MGFCHLIKQLVHVSAVSATHMNELVAFNNLPVHVPFYLRVKPYVLTGAITDIGEAVQRINAHTGLIGFVEQPLIASGNFCWRDSRKRPGFKLKEYGAHICDGFAVLPQLYAKRLLPKRGATKQAER